MSIAPVIAPQSIPRGLPAWTYRHPEMQRLEIERLIRPSWQIVCHVNSVARAGDYVTLEIGRDSVVVLRDASGGIGAFHNVCRHRAARLLEGEGSCRGVVACPYHGWTYALDGSLRGMPIRESFPGLDRAEFGLNPVRTEIMAGFVFVCLAGDPPPLRDTWGIFLDDFAPYRFEDLVPLTPIYHEHWDVDWKVAMDNYLESYHVPVGHPGLNRMFTPDYADQASLDSGVARGISWLLDRKSPRWSERLYAEWAPKVATALPERERRCWRFYSALPNLGIDVFADQMDFFQVLPRGPGRCTIRGGTFGLPDDRREMKLLRYLNTRINRQVQREDEFLCDRVQKGLASSAYTPGPLSTLESCMLRFHDLIRERIPEAAEAGAPASFR
jgi:phenylpropionate dioxygenase-like ring-hydroxylating dioxygenase large terminal subunit